MPNSRNWIVTAPALPPPCSTGTGNSPPTRKLASLPLVVTRFGSARICNTPCACSALMNAPRFRSGRKAKMFSASVSVNGVWPPPPIELIEGGRNCPVLMRADRVTRASGNQVDVRVPLTHCD